MVLVSQNSEILSLPSGQPGVKSAVTSDSVLAGCLRDRQVGRKRIPVFFIYMDRVATISESYKKKYGIPDDLYQEYKNDLKASQTVYDGYVIGNKVVVPFDVISEEDLNVIFKATVDIAKKLTETS